MQRTYVDVPVTDRIRGRGPVYETQDYGRVPVESEYGYQEAYPRAGVRGGRREVPISHRSGGLSGGIDYDHDIGETYTTVRGTTAGREHYIPSPHGRRNEVITERSVYVDEEPTEYYSNEYYSGDEYEDQGYTTTEYSTTDYLGERRSKSGKKKWNPIIDMGETKSYWIVRCEIPGVRKDRLHVEVQGKELVIKAKRVKELWSLDKLGAAPAAVAAPAATTTPVASGAPAKQKFQPDPRMAGVRWVNKERGGKGTFKRRVRLPERVDNSAIQATYKDGILEVLVKKPEMQAIKQAKAAGKVVPVQHD